MTTNMKENGFKRNHMTVDMGTDIHFCEGVV